MNNRCYKLKSVIAAVTVAAVMFSGCSSGSGNDRLPITTEPVYDAGIDDMELKYIPYAPGTGTFVSDAATIDYSNCSEGYVMVRYEKPSDSKIIAQLESPMDRYAYTIEAEQWAVLPLTGGDGKYTVSIYECVGGSKYALMLSGVINVEIANEFSPFLYPNLYVNYLIAPNTVATAKLLADEGGNTLKTVENVYDFVTGWVIYDNELAQDVESGYVPVLDEILEKRSGICFDYASLMTGMLRSLDIPCKLVFGYADSAYHAWINVWTEENGWVDNAIFFNGTDWQRMDPTMAKAIADGEDIVYTEKCYF